MLKAVMMPFGLIGAVQLTVTFLALIETGLGANTPPGAEEKELRGVALYILTHFEQRTTYRSPSFSRTQHQKQSNRTGWQQPHGTGTTRRAEET